MKDFRGIATALITPMRNDGSVDIDVLRKLVARQIKNGAAGLVPVGTTGESPTLSHQEHRDVIAACVSENAGKAKVIAGAGSNSTSEACDLANFAAKQGVDAILVVAPYYNRPNQTGLFEHYAAIAETVAIPIIIYNIPSRSVVSVAIDTLARLFEKYPHVCGIKDAESSDLGRVSAIRTKLGADYLQLSGDDATFAGHLAMGGHGIISVASNVAPKLYAELAEAWQQGRRQQFDRIRDSLYPLAKALMLEPSPAPTKYALGQLQLCSDMIRLPLVKCSITGKQAVDAALQPIIHEVMAA